MPECVSLPWKRQMFNMWLLKLLPYTIVPFGYNWISHSYVIFECVCVMTESRYQGNSKMS